MNIARKKENGFTFVEILISMSILAVGLLALSSMQGTFAEGNAQNRELTTAMNLASGKIAEVQAEGFSDVTEADLNWPSQEKKGRVYEFDTDVDNLGSNAKQVQVSVSWKSYGRNRRVSLDWVKRNGTGFN